MDETTIYQVYKNCFWTRLIAVEGFQAVRDDEDAYKWPIGPEILEECNAVAELPQVDANSWEPLFDHNQFQEQNGPLEIEKFRLPQEDL